MLQGQTDRPHHCHRIASYLRSPLLHALGPRLEVVHPGRELAVRLLRVQRGDLQFLPEGVGVLLQALLRPLQRQVLLAQRVALLVALVVPDLSTVRTQQFPYCRLVAHTSLIMLRSTELHLRVDVVQAVLAVQHALLELPLAGLQLVISAQAAGLQLVDPRLDGPVVALDLLLDLRDRERGGR